jgi:hypothetical protein
MFVHTYSYIEQFASDHDVKYPTITRSGVLGDVKAAQALVAETRGLYDALSSEKMRQGVEGDDPVDIMADNALLFMKVNLATDAVRSAEGMLAMALRRLADFNRRTQMGTTPESTEPVR